MADFKSNTEQLASGFDNIKLSTSIIVCATACLFFIYEFILQVSPNVMTNDLMRDLRVDAAGIGIISGSYYIAYTAMQIPAGLLYDRFGPRSLLTIASIICAMGAFAFGLTDSYFTASVGRFSMGIGSAFAFIGCLVLVSRWFKPQYFALLAGLVQLMSSVGALIGEAPLAAAVSAYDWREVMTIIAVAGIVVASLIWLIVRDAPASVKVKHHINRGELKRLLTVCSKKQTWLVAIYAFTSWAPILVFAALWGVPFLVAKYGISSTNAASAVSMVWISIGFGSPLIGWWSDQIGRRVLPLLMCSTIGLISISIILFMPHLPYPMVFPLLLLFGFSASSQALSFALVKDNNCPSMVGTAIGFNNTMVVCGGILFQPLVGFILRSTWDGSMANNVPVYSAHDYRTALSIIPLCFIVGIVSSLFFLKESYCKPTHE